MKSTWPKNGTKRIRSGFLFLDKRIGTETRWWEHATWEEKVVHYYNPRTGKDTHWAWRPIRWIDEPPVEESP